ncbi:MULTISPECIES: YbaB/EbfC family DNA-binding protein [unclassified Pigmentiphaga]|uniref:YbaB/EbfC family DNA-binding protein n=1 Tax=unclassified Pigmentiphaga TaxID=2626614 RepID=UPI00104D9248|nr:MULTISPECIES: YbaB/EbfC family DNA-binding protein [unclassified Pigmentiphaga]
MARSFSSNRSRSPGRGSPFARVRERLARLAGALGLGLTTAAGGPAAAQAPAQPVPQHWISYAQMTGNQFQAWLSDPDSQAVQRLHAWMQERMLQEGPAGPPAPLIVRVWVGQAGKVERLEFASLGQPQADEDLRALLTAQPLSEPPPPDMRQPMVLQLELGFVAKG